MSTKQHQRPAEQILPPAEGTLQTAAKVNSQQIEQMKAAAYQANYEDALGKYLGGALYRNLSKFLEPQQMASLANGLLDGLIREGISQLADHKGATLPEDVMDQLSSTLLQEMTPFVDSFLASDSGVAFTNYLRDVVGENPYPVAGVAILAAVGAILADMDVPELSQRFGITDNLSAGIGAKLGSFKNIALESVSASLKYNSELLTASVKVKRNEEGLLSGRADAQVGTEEQHVRGEVSIDETGLTAHALGGVLTIGDKTTLSATAEGNATAPLTNVSVNVDVEGANATHNAGVNYDHTSQDVTGQYGISKEDGLSMMGSVTGNLASQQLEAYRISSNYQSSNSPVSISGEFEQRLQDQSIQYGSDISYSGMDDRLRLSGGVNGSQTGLETISGSGEYDFQNMGLTVGGGLSHHLREQSYEYDAFARYNGLNDTVSAEAAISGNNERLRQLSLSGAYRPNEQDFYSVKYDHQFDSKRHNLDMTAQKRLNDFSIRGRQVFTYGPSDGFSASSELLGAYHIDSDLSVIGGAEYRHDQMGERVLPKAGIQYKDVPIVITYDPEMESASVGIVLKF